MALGDWAGDGWIGLQWEPRAVAALLCCVPGSPLHSLLPSLCTIRGRRKGGRQKAQRICKGSKARLCLHLGPFPGTGSGELST